ncbi:hypothetical protein [Curtobacterium sp. VKM Ac-2922]|uniref:hypothetical protein n=1 Tax=Curtobacterium sp. VKM Ac-2922 TaxID=2929475 RepID=UPI001FB3970B|nr:hypothetical protein [Curtobacterium sp. VKM Ac-2922]MCJ1715254.1 hypothetical protein [Curtobacterium sp. VKM Ac-2922]
MDPQRFDGMAGLALSLLLPVAVLFVASAIRVSRAPRWTWLVFLAAVGGLLVGSAEIHWSQYPTPADNEWGRYDGGQFLGFRLGFVGVTVNAAVCAVHGLVTDSRRRWIRPFTVLEARLLTASSLALATACAAPAAWWVSGAGLPPWPVPVLPAALGLSLAVVAWVRADRRGLGLDAPVLRVVSAIVGCALAVAVVSSGSGGPDLSLVPDTAPPRQTPASTPDPWADWPAASGPHPVDTTTLDAAAVQDGTRAMLQDTVRWAGPLDDLSSPTPAAAPAPPVALRQVACPSGGSRWTGTLTLPTARPQDVATRVLRGWEHAGYTAADRAMGTDTRWPIDTDAAVQRMQIGGDRTGVQVTAESFCV